MKKLDRGIQNIVIAILIITFLTISIVDIEVARNIIVFIIGSFYFIFFVFHAFLLMPFGMLLMLISDYIKDTKFYTNIKAKSDILGWWTIAAPFIIAVFIIYWLIPVLTCMLYLGTLNMGEGIEQLNKIIR